MDITKTKVKIVSSETCSMFVYYDKDDFNKIMKIEFFPAEGQEYIDADSLLFGDGTEFLGVRITSSLI